MAKLVCKVTLSGKFKRKVKFYAFCYASFKFLCPSDELTEKFRCFLFERLHCQLKREIKTRFNRQLVA